VGYRNLQECVHDLERHGELIRIDREIDPVLEAGAIQRRVYRAGGPAILFTGIKGCEFPMLANLFGSRSRIRFLFRDTLQAIEKIAKLKQDPLSFLRDPLGSAVLPLHVSHLFPAKIRSAPVLANRTTIAALPQLKSWPDDGGAFITLPQVYSESPATPGWRRSNLGMYRIQLSGGCYRPDQEIGIHYQIHRGIAAHHDEAIRRGTPPEGKHLYRRPPGPCAGRNYAVAGRYARTCPLPVFWADAGCAWSSHPERCRFLRRPISASLARWTRSGRCRKARSATISATIA